jgi:hypothetical protein
MAQPGLGESGDVLKRIADRGLCMAVGGHVCQPGTVRLGDEVSLSPTERAPLLRRPG